MSDESKFKQVQADKWHEMSTTDLFEQLSILRARAYTANMMGNVSLINQIMKGINDLESIIANKKDEDGISLI